MKNKIMNLAVAMLSVAFLLTGCSEEDFPQPQQSGAAGTLHIASISIDGQQVKSRAVADDGKQYGFNKYAYNQSLNSFAEDGDELVMEYSFGVVNPQVAFINYKDGNWSFTEASVSETEVINTGNPITIVPGEGVDWDDLYFMVIASNDGIVLEGDKEPYADVATELGIVQGNFDKENIRLAADWLYAYSENGSLTVDTDIKSPTLGAVSATLKHGFRSLLRLPKSAISIDTRNPYLVGGQNYSVTGLATLWAVMTKEGGTGTTYFPLTQVDSNLQSIISLQDCPYLTGFKAVLYTTESGQPGDEGYDATKVLTLDLPLKAGTETRIRLEENYMYLLTLNISPNRSSVTLSGDGLGKPGWGEDEDETTLDNGLNEAKNELSYTSGSDNNAGIFSVSGPNGLTLLNKWMMEAITTEAFQSAGFTGANDIPADVNPMAQNITFTADITLPAPKDGESNWTPVGNADKPYTGTIDGAGKTLTGMVINSTDRNQGFVGYLGEGGKVQNLTFNDAQVTGEINTAIVVGRMVKNSTVENCHTTATSSVKSNSMNLGGLVGNNYGIITRCSNAAQVEGPGIIGGIVGENHGIVSACTNSGAVSADLIAGGIVGNNFNDGSVIACGNTGTVNALYYSVGGIVGYNWDKGNVIASWTQDTNETDNNGNAPSSPENGVGYEAPECIITACHVFSQASSVTAAHITTMNIAIAAWNATDGNIAVAYGWQAATTSGQWPSLALITELSDSWPVKEGGFYKIGTDYYTAAGVKVDPIGTDFYIDGTDYYTAAGVKVEGFALADGTATVSTANALLLWNAMAQTRRALNLTLTADITLPQPAEGGSNWTPVGVDEYTGTINGGGHTLTGMVINSTGYNLGFVGNLNDGGKVQNLTFADATVISSSGYNIGIVVGLNKESTVENCHTTGSSSVKGYATVGGIVGSNQEGFVSACINRSAVSATVINEGFLGGVGGIVGDNLGDVIACGNTGVVSGYINVGGIVGNHYEGNVIASWTQDTNEKDNDGNAPSSTENGVGQEWDGIITACHVFSQASDVTTELISDMNKAIEKYNYRWEAVTDGYPTLKTVTE